MTLKFEIMTSRLAPSLFWRVPIHDELWTDYQRRTEYICFFTWVKVKIPLVQVQVQSDIYLSTEVLVFKTSLLEYQEYKSTFSKYCIDTVTVLIWTETSYVQLWKMLMLILCRRKELKVKSSHFHLFSMLFYLTFKKMSEYSENWNSLARWSLGLAHSRNGLHGCVFIQGFVHGLISYLNLTILLWD